LEETALANQFFSNRPPAIGTVLLLVAMKNFIRRREGTIMECFRHVIIFFVLFFFTTKMGVKA
jgi:hypothetical protein